MKRYAYKLRSNRTRSEAYEREHTRVWPELLIRLKEEWVSQTTPSSAAGKSCSYVCVRMTSTGLGRTGPGPGESALASVDEANSSSRCPTNFRASVFAMMQEVFYLP